MSKKILIIILLTTITHSIECFSLPKAVVLIRHGEKIDDTNPHLSPQGYERARLLPSLFLNNPDLKALGTPSALFAAGKKHADSSVRSQETLNDLSTSLNVPINSSFQRDDVASLTDEIKNNPLYNGKVIVICWEHKVLSLIVDNLIKNLKEIPIYPSSKFDRLWIIKYDKNNAGTFINLPQHLLPNDDVK